MGKRFGSDSNPVGNLFDPTPEGAPKAELNELETELKALDAAKIPRVFLNMYLHEKGNEQKNILKKDGRFTQHFFKYFLNIAEKDFDRLDNLNVTVLSEGNQALLDEVLEGMEDLEPVKEDVVKDDKEEGIVKGYIEKNSELIKKLDDLNINYISSRESESNLIEESEELKNLAVKLIKIFADQGIEDSNNELDKDSKKLIKELYKE